MTRERPPNVALKARQLQGLVPYLLDHPHQWFVPSVSAIGRGHLVSGPPDQRRCTCTAGSHGAPCWHTARVAQWLGEDDDG